MLFTATYGLAGPFKVFAVMNSIILAREKQERIFGNFSEDPSNDGGVTLAPLNYALYYRKRPFLGVEITEKRRFL